jgi:hypothetical protein
MVIKLTYKKLYSCKNVESEGTIVGSQSPNVKFGKLAKTSKRYILDGYET